MDGAQYRSRLTPLKKGVRNRLIKGVRNRKFESVPDPFVRREERWRANPAPAKRLALRVLSGEKEFIITRNDIAGFVH